ncbi:MAG: SagB/ThcOx family dehydrogenase [Methanotrichaceae archaeon]
MNKPKTFAIIGLSILAIAVIAVLGFNGYSAQDSSKAIKLPEPLTNGSVSVEKALQERRSIRSFGKNGLTLNEVSELLWAAQGVTDDQGHRTAPSAMAKYPLEVYLLAGNVSGLPQGVYHYIPQNHSLAVVTQGKVDEYYNASAGFEGWIKIAPAIFVIIGDMNRMNTLPGRDLSRWVYIEGGAAAENLLLEVVSLNLASTYTAGFDANRTTELLGLSPGEVPMGVLPVGRKA